MPSRPNLALIRAVAWRRLAAARARLRRPAPQAPSPGDRARGPQGPDAANPPTPLLVDYFGRDGSTALMRLLGSSPRVLVEGAYPFEAQRLVATLRSHQLLGEGDARVAPDPDVEGLTAALLAESHRLPGGLGASYWAEKLIDGDRLRRESLPPHRLVALLRDPRDTLVSVEAFTRAVGPAEIGGGADRDETVARFIRRQRKRLRWIESLRGDRTATVVEYRELVEDLDVVAARLSGWLGVELSPRDVARDFRLRWVHGTSVDPRRSIGRWRGELDPATVALLERELGTEMRAAGFA